MELNKAHAMSDVGSGRTECRVRLWQGHSLVAAQRIPFDRHDTIDE
jgi:hypothetical protein